MAELHKVEIESEAPSDPSLEAAISEAPQSEPVSSDNRPEWLPEKFTSAEELAKAYQALEQRQSTANTANPAQISKAATPEPVALDSEKYTKEMIANGGLSEESLAEIKTAGIPESMIETHLAGLEAIRDAQVNRLNNIAGGQEQWGTMQTWAANNLSDSEVDAFNNAIQSGDSGQTEFAMAGLRARFESAVAGTGLEGSTGTAPGDGFESNAQMVEAMRDPRYQRDPAYRQEVLRRVAGMKG